jgi:transposase
MRMVHVHGQQVERLAAQTRGLPAAQLVAVPIDVGKATAMALACDFSGQLLVRAFEFPLTLSGVAELVRRVEHVGVQRSVCLIRVGIEAAGHYHQPLVSTGVLPAAWQIVEFNPAHVAAQRRARGQRGVKTDQLDLVAISDLLIAGHGAARGRPDPAMVELVGLVAHRDRRVQLRTATKNQLLGQVDRAFPGLAGCLSSLLDTKVGRLLVTEFAEPARLARLGPVRFRTFAAQRGVAVSTMLAQRLVAAAKDVLPTDQAGVARRVLAEDLALLAHLDAQISAAEWRLATLLPKTPFQVLTTTPGWGVVRAAAYAAAVGDLARWPSARQLYRAAGLCPTVYASAGHRRDGGISREGSVPLRRALLSLGVGLWRCDPAGRAYAAALRARGKPGGVVATALAHRANKIAFAMVRDQAPTTRTPGGDISPHLCIPGRACHARQQGGRT